MPACNKCEKEIEETHPNQCEVCSQHFCDCDDHLFYLITEGDSQNYLACGQCVLANAANDT